MKFKTFTLDPFQEDSVKSIESGNSVVVSAATGTGKTLIADYIIDKYLKEKRRVIYTAPIKALSAQKYRDFKEDYGEENIGIMTGDIVINPGAPILIMTTEIYRNMLLTKDPIIEHVSYVIFDEIHFINDIERGTIWEESVIFSPEHIRFLCLSATIPNAEEFAAWIMDIKKHTVDVVRYAKRAVPLNHLVYDQFLGITNVEKVMSDKENTDFVKSQRSRKKSKKKNRHQGVPKTDHKELINLIEDKLPCIFFDFSRRECEERAIKLAKSRNFTSDKEKKHIIELTNKLIGPEYRSLHSVQNLKYCLSRGIGFHHAGVLPKAKEVVELLFSEGIIKVLYATETFAVGINMPAKTVCFASLEKFDGISFRYINSKEYFQLAGRAGRRGIDNVGYAIAVIERGQTNLHKLKDMSERDDIPIQSQFRLSINTVLNLVNNHKPKERETILRMNFDYFLKKKESTRQVRIMASFNNKVKTLKKLGYIQGDNLTDKGLFAAKVYSNEMLITEMFSNDFYKNFTDHEINVLIAAIIYEPRRRDYFTLKGIDNVYRKMMRHVSNREFLFKNLNKLHIKRMINVVGGFSKGIPFMDLLEMCSLDEGDLIRLFRRIIDMNRQIQKASGDQDLIERLHSCHDKMYKGVIKFEF
jgi:superfamily II RNA helicase